MANHLGVPGITVQELDEKRSNGAKFILLDVREFHELSMANLGDEVTNIPLSEIAKQYENALPEEIRKKRDSEIIVLCHHGVRSAQVVAWMQASQFSNVWNLDGGIEAYADEIDRTIGRY